MKKIISLFISVLLIFFGAFGCNCGNTTDSDKPNKDPIENVVNTDIVFAENGRSEYVIVIPQDADDCIKYSAELLKDYVLKSTGASLPVQTDEGRTFSESEKVISLGNTLLKKSAGISVTKDEVNIDGYKMTRKGNTLFIAGNISRGTMYGVYDFLKLICGYETYAVDTVYFNTVTKAYLPDADLTIKPSFIGRAFDGGTISATAAGLAALRLRSFRPSPMYGENGYVTEDWMGLSVHATGSYINVGKKDASYVTQDNPSGWTPTSNAYLHPRWFTHKGNTVTDRQLCWTNEEVLEELVRLIQKNILDHPGGTWINVDENDMCSFCKCDEEKDRELSWCGMNCKESADKYTVSGSQVRWLNEIIRRVEEWRKVTCPEHEVKYVCMAYTRGETLPSPTDYNKETKTFNAKDASCVPDEKLYIRWTPLMSCFYHEITDETCAVNKQFATAIKGWSAITNRFTIYDYKANYSNYLPFYNNLNAVQKNMKYYNSIGVTDYFTQGATGATVTSLCDLQYYIYAKLCWNVDHNLENIVNDFMDKFYGAGAPYMKEYLTLIRTHLAGIKGYHQTNYDSSASDKSKWPLGIVEKCLALFDQATDAVNEAYGDAVASKYARHILKESVCIRYIYLKNYTGYGKSKSTLEYKNTVAAFKKDCDLLKVSADSESSSISTFLNSL